MPCLYKDDKGKMRLCRRKRTLACGEVVKLYDAQTDLLNFEGGKKAVWLGPLNTRINPEVKVHDYITHIL